MSHFSYLETAHFLDLLNLDFGLPIIKQDSNANLPLNPSHR